MTQSFSGLGTASAAKTAALSAVGNWSQRKLHRKCGCGKPTPAGATCSDCAKGARSGEVAPIVHDVLATRGNPLPESQRTSFERRFDHDFSRVRIHDDANAARSAAAVGALAYTVGNSIVMGEGWQSASGMSPDHVMAHELAHVVQQEGASASGSLRVAPHNDPAEAAADAAANIAMSSGGAAATAAGVQPGALTLQRLGANPGCTPTQAKDIQQAIFNANSWVGKTLTKLAASPLDAVTLAALRTNFGASGTAANAATIATRLAAGKSDMNSMPFSCAGTADAICAAGHCGYAPSAGSHSCVICTNSTLATNDAVFRAGCVLHESMHASNASMSGDSYSGWRGHSSSTAGYPGADPLNNADSYASLAIDLS